ncbi:glutathione S-transferase T3-like [Alnus glutinosa]|uniref:glutathione S-transferase T3-like n=1 Tax=Alnus glutinosa TaxID=3517 RepID=UPI002D770D55|nr:glutathione S-transferase T3-like [Alnus glutinosa]
MVDDNLLVEAWLYVSMDAVQGNQQKNKVYWKRICDYFHERKTLGANRNQTSLMNRWSTIQLAVNKFCGFLAQIEKRSQSGLTEQDKICQARQMFVDIQKSPFNFEHSWLILRFHPKWLAHLDNIKLKKKPVVINLGDEKVPHKAFEEIERPIGGKAENEKRKSKEKIKLFEEACEQDKEMFFLKQEEVRLRERELRLRKKTLRLEEEREIKEFMLLDISQLDEDGKEYVRRRKKAILQGCGTSVDDVISGDILLSRE